MIYRGNNIPLDKRMD